MNFEYGGYGDTIYALIDGNIYEMDTLHNLKDSLRPLDNVMITVEQNNKMVLTDTNGQFIIGLEKGVYSLSVSKDGYKPLKITNYVSRPDQVSKTKIVLEKGLGLQLFEIPESGR